MRGGGIIMCWVYRKNGSIFEVGYFTPDGEFIIVSETTSGYEARQEVHFLNGGDPQK